MSISFSVLVGLLTFFCVVVTGFASLPQLIHHASDTTAAMISLFATDATENIVAGIEHSVNETTDAVSHVKTATIRIGNPFDHRAGSGARSVAARQWMHELWEQGHRLLRNSGLVVRWASDSSVMLALKAATVKTQLCQSQDRFLGPPFNNRLFDRLENCSIAVLMLPEGTLVGAKHPIATEPFLTNFRTAYCGVEWNLTKNTMLQLRAISNNSGAVRGFWVPRPLFFAEFIVGNLEQLPHFRTGFVYQYTTMSWDLVTNHKPIAMANGRTIFTEFGATLRQLLPTDNSRAFLVDGLDNVMSYSHGQTFQLRNRSNPADELFVGQKNCHLYTATEPVFGCFHNISSHPDFEMLNLVMSNKTSPIAAVLSASRLAAAREEDDLADGDHRLMRIPRMVTLANGSRFVAFTKPLRNSFVGFTFQAYIFIPVDYFEQGVVAARTLTIAVVAVVGVFGALLSVAVVWWTTRSVAELAERMSEDPFGTKDRVGAAARQKFLQQKQQMLAEIFGEASPSSSSLYGGSSRSEFAAADDDTDQLDANGVSVVVVVPPFSFAFATSSTAAAVNADSQGGAPSCWQQFVSFFSQFEEITTLEEEFEAFREVIDELRGFLQLPVPVSNNNNNNRNHRNHNSPRRRTTDATLREEVSRAVNDVLSGHAAAGDIAERGNNKDSISNTTSFKNSNNNSRDDDGGNNVHAVDDSTKKRKRRVVITDSVEVTSEDDSVSPIFMADAPVAAHLRASFPKKVDRPQVRSFECKATTLFVAVIHVTAFNGAEREAVFASPPPSTTASTTPSFSRAAAAQSSSARASDAQFLQFASLVVESLNFLAVSSGATLTEFHGDHFLICVQSRAASVTKMPTRFAMRLAHFSRLFAAWLARENDAVRRRFELSAGLSMSSATMFVDGLEAAGNSVDQQRPVSFFGPCFGEAFGIEHALRTYAPAITPADLQQQLQREASSAATMAEAGVASGFQKAAAAAAAAIGTGLHLQIARRSAGDYASGTELREGADEFSLKHRVNNVKDDDDEDGDNMMVRESDANTIRNAVAGVLDVVRRQQQRRQDEQAATEKAAPTTTTTTTTNTTTRSSKAAEADARTVVDGNNRPIPHCIGFPTRLQDMFEFVRCVSFKAPTFRKSSSAITVSADDSVTSATFSGVGACAGSMSETSSTAAVPDDPSRKPQEMLRVVQVTRIARPNRVLPIAPS